MRKIDYEKIIKIGDRYGTLTIIQSPRRVPKGKSPMWFTMVRCDCGHEQNASCAKWKRNEYIQCRLCKIKGKNNYAWNGIHEISGDFLYKIRSNAKRIGVEYSLTKDFLWNLFIQQNRKCSLSGMDLWFKSPNKLQTASLDRIDSSKGYIVGNVQWIHKDINRMKNEFSQNYFIDVCKRISRMADK